MLKMHRKKGKLLIALGLLAGAGAIALLVSGRRTAAGDTVGTGALPEVERRDALAAEQAVAASSGASDDAVGDAERRVDNTLAGKPALPEQPAQTRRGRHAARE